ncbi:hypothetical protein AUP68_13836 [Ilyonectria robusta]
MTSRFGRRYKREHIPTLKVPAAIPWLGYAALAIAALICLHGLVTFFLTAFAVSGKQTTKLKLPLIARAIQWTELAITIVGLVFFDFYFLISQRYHIKELKSFYSQRNVRFFRKCLVWCWFPSRLVFLGVWIVLAAFQSRYIPILGHKTLSDCSGLWIDKKRCNAVNGSWIAAIIYCILYSASLGVNLTLILRLRCSENDFENLASANDMPNAQASRSVNGPSSIRGPYAPIATED